MSAQQFFSEVEAVANVLADWANDIEPEDLDVLPEERFTALWQAVELLSRSHAVLIAMANFEMSKAALDVPDVVRRQVPKLYDGQGKPLA